MCLCQNPGGACWGTAEAVQPFSMAVAFLAQKCLHRMSFLKRKQAFLRERFAAHAAEFMSAAVNDGLAIRAAALAFKINSPGKEVRPSNFELLRFPFFDFADNCTHAR